MLIDLHTHTNASDGYLPRAELIEFAALMGVKKIAITDHDTMKNSYSAEGEPVEVIEGVELSAIDKSNGRKVHILCYLPTRKQALTPFFDRIQKSRCERGERYFEELRRIYPIITRERLDRYSNGAYAYMKQHFMDVLIDYGYADEVYGDLYKLIFDEMLKTPCDADYDDVYTAIAAARDAGGAVVLAHPSVYDSMRLAHTLCQKGLIDGIERDHYRNNEADKKTITELCERYSLILTGGSDYHARTNNKPVLVGMATTDERQLERIQEISYKRR